MKVKLIVIIFSIIAMIVWLVETVRRVFSWVTSIPPSFWWGLVVILVLSSLSFLVWRNPTRRKGVIEVVKRPWFLWPATILILVVGYQFFHEESGLSQSGSGRVAAYVLPAGLRVAPRLSADVVLPIIAECESGSRQFDESGHLIKNPESTAIGKYQIMASLHEKRAGSLGFDIRTEEGNERYARYLYEESGTAHWERDSRSKVCWGPKLLAMNDYAPASISTIWEIEVGRELSPWIKVPLGQKVFLERAISVDYEMITQAQEIFYFPREMKKNIEIPGILSGFRLRVVDEEIETAKFRFRFTPI